MSCKMSRQNPGGEVVTRPTMKGCEKFQARGKGDIQTGYASPGHTKFGLRAQGLKGMVPAGKARGY